MSIPLHGLTTVSYTHLAVYTISDPRALLLKELARDLAREKGKDREFAFLELLEERAIATFGRIKTNGKTVSVSYTHLLAVPGAALHKSLRRAWLFFLFPEGRGQWRHHACIILC